MSVANVTASSTLIEAVDGVLVDHQDAGAFCEQVAAAGEGAIDADAGAGNGGRNFRSGAVLRDVALLDARHHDFFDAGAHERGHFLLADQRALLEYEIALADGMHRGGAERLVHGDGAEFHAASASFSAFSRSVWVISAMMASAISAGDTAPIGKPMGA